jgi:hypothetical protein
MELPPLFRPVWNRLRAAYPEGRLERSPVPRLAGSAIPEWFVVLREPAVMALRPTPDALELYAGTIEDASTCLLGRAHGDEEGRRLLARALGDDHPLSGAFALRFAVPEAEGCWPARALLAPAPALGVLGDLATSLDLHPAGLHAVMPWSAAAPEAVARALAACGEYLDVLSAPPESLEPYAAAQAVLEEVEAGEAGAGEAEDGSSPPVRGFKPRFPRGLADVVPPVALRWIAGLGLPLAGFAALAALGRVVPWLGRHVTTDSALGSVLFAVGAGALGLEALRRLAEGRRPPAPLGPAGPLVEDWRRDALLHAAPGLLLLLFAWAIASPAGQAESDAPCINVGIGLASALGGAWLAGRSLRVAGRVLLHGPGLLWLRPDPPVSGGELQFRVKVPGRRPLPGLHATLRCARTRVEGQESLQVVPRVYFCRSTALLPVAGTGQGRLLEGRFILPEGVSLEEAAGGARAVWELTAHGARARRFPDLCFVLPAPRPSRGSAEPEEGPPEVPSPP